MAITKCLKWKELTSEEQEVAVSCGKLTNPKDFLYHRVVGRLFAVNEDHAWIVNISAEYADVDAYEEFFEFADEGDDGITSDSCLIPITTDQELTDDEVCKDYFGIDPAHITDISVGF